MPDTKRMPSPRQLLLVGASVFPPHFEGRKGYDLSDEDFAGGNLVPFACAWMPSAYSRCWVKFWFRNVQGCFTRLIVVIICNFVIMYNYYFTLVILFLSRKYKPECWFLVKVFFFFAVPQCFLNTSCQNLNHLKSQVIRVLCCMS